MKGIEQIATRMANAEAAFVEVIMAKGFTKEQAQKALGTMLKLKVAKLDAIIGAVNVKHGAFLEVDAIQAAVDYK